jgi:hypothetical protein
MFRFAMQLPKVRKRTGAQSNGARSGSAGFAQTAQTVPYYEEDDPLDFDMRIVKALAEPSAVQAVPGNEPESMDLSEWDDLSIEPGAVDEIDEAEWDYLLDSADLQEADDLPSLLEEAAAALTGLESAPAHGNEYYARWSFGEVRERFFSSGIKSANKFVRGDPHSIHRVQAAMRIVGGIQAAIYENWPIDYSIAMTRGAGNCQEMAGAAAQMVLANGGHATVYAVDFNGSHAFTLVGRAPASAIDHVGMQDYQGCWVVDPWAGLLCPAPVYCSAFDQQMRNWAERGKMISNHGEWIEPTDPHWLTAIMNGPKHPVQAQPPGGRDATSNPHLR